MTNPFLKNNMLKKHQAKGSKVDSLKGILPKMDNKKQGSWKKRRKKERKMQESKRTSQEENADAV